jgi:uncharacterized membrane protein YgcG
LTGPPFDFSAEDEERVDPVDLLAIRADDELLDALASGRPAGLGLGPGFDPRWDAGYTDDQQVLAMLAGWRADLSAEPIPELVSTDEALAAIRAGQRAAAAPRRRLVPVAAAAVFAIALGAVGAAAHSAQPGDPLWGVSKVMDGNRAKSVEAAYRVDMALSTAQQALAKGRVAEARAVLASVAPELNQVQDQQRKEELAEKTDNLRDVASSTPEGQEVTTDERGRPREPDHPRDRDKASQNSGSSPSSQPPSSGPGSPDERKQGQNPDQQQSQHPDQQQGQNPDQRRQGQNPGQQGQNPDQQGQNPDQRRQGADAPSSQGSSGTGQPAPDSAKSSQDSGKTNSGNPGQGNPGGGNSGAKPGGNPSGGHPGGPGPGGRPASNPGGIPGLSGAHQGPGSGGDHKAPNGDKKGSGGGKGDGEPAASSSGGSDEGVSPTGTQQSDQGTDHTRQPGPRRQGPRDQQPKPTS